MAEKPTYEQLERRIKELEQAVSAAVHDLDRVRFSVENLTDSLFWVGEDGYFIDFNEAACKKLGYSREELMRMYVHDIDPNFPHERWSAHLEEMQKRKSMRIETAHRSATGEFIPMELTINYQQLGNKRYNCVLARDITERKLIEESLKQSEAEFRAIFEVASVGIVQVYPETGQFIRCNQTYCDILGYTEEELRALKFPELTHPEDRESDFKLFQSAARRENPGYVNEKRYIRKDGRVIWVRLNAAFVRDDNHRAIRTVAVCEDITERKLVEERMARHQKELDEINRLGLIANSSLDLNVVLKLILQSAAKAVNASVGMIFLKDTVSSCLTLGASIGLSEEFIHDFKNKPIQFGEGLTGTIAQTGEPIFIPEDSSRDHRIVRSVIRKEGLNSFLGVPIIADEEIVGVMNILTRPPEQLSEQDVPFCAAIGSQVGFAIRNAQVYTAKKKAEEALREREELLSGILENLQDAYFRADLSGRFVFVNATAPQMYGYESGEQLIGMSAQELYADSGAREALLNELRRHGTVKDWVGRGLRADGSAFWVSMNARLMRDSDGQVVGTEGVVRDITERKQAEEALRESSALLARSQQIGHLGSWKLEVPANRLEWTDEVFRIFGCEPQEFASTYEAFLDFVHPDDRAAVDDAYSRSLREASDGYEIEHRIVRKATGEVRFVHERCVHEFDENGTVIKSVGMVQDITERKRTEEELADQKSRYQGIWEESPVSIWEEDWSGVITILQRLQNQGVDDYSVYFDQHPEVVEKHSAQ